MSINIGPPAIEELRPRIVVIGVGGAGGNAIANMIQAQIEGVDFVVANTDAQALNNSIAETRIQLGPEITQGLGAGARPEVGRAAAEETIEDIERLLEGVHMVFIAAGMGGGTGTGAAPIIAQAARAKGVLTVGVVSKPFMFEGTRRMRSADAGIEELQKHVDTLIVIPNQNLFLVAKAETTFKEAFSLADEVLQQGVRSITDLMIMPGLINLDFADVRSVMGEMGKAMMGTGEGEGPNRALEAAERAIANPLLDGVSMQGAKGVIISIIGGDDMKLLEVDEAANHIRELVDPDANIIWGSAFNPDLQGKIRVSVVATGIEQTTEMAEIASRPLNLSTSRGPVRPMVSRPVPSAPAPLVTPAPAAAVPPAPAAPASEPFELSTPAPEAAEPFELELGASQEVEQEAPVAYAGLRNGGGESLDRAAPAQAPAAPHYSAPQHAAPQFSSGAQREQDELRLNGGQAVSRAPEPAPAPAPVQPAPARPAGGSTLFERMTSLSRPKAAPAEPAGDDDDSGSISIPRFLGRQNNQ
ncbi:MAG: cell division protein FtsZ [Novosphingobium lindaniclasticum]|jgi:cell division protein FtsZ|uniref:cell division protein FtsZ n=1 Tax=Novosphingobium lindaniclasticum TaxID=1329895 RepID=UPI0024095965|nr:cell division protein FtsZ [Novosphingobium lindaniclasticum]MDF2638039.1 cell division protein FtsZ [Novosphingobium lindaniclasticum]